MQVAKTRFGMKAGEALTQEFHICVTPVGQGDYLVQTEQVAPGVPVAQEVVKLPIADWLTQLNTIWHDRSQLLSQTPTNPSLTGNLPNLVVLGQQFYTALFQGSLRNSWITAQKIAQQQRGILRLRLGLKETELNSLPWEILHTGDRFLITYPCVIFSRYQADIEDISLPTLSLPLNVVKVLMVIAAPTEQANLALKQEAIRLQVELCQLQFPSSNTTEFEFTLLEHPSRAQLLQTIKQEQYQILHYIGQSNLAASKKELYLNLGNCAEKLNADELANLFSQHNIQIAVFNLCHHTRTCDTAALDLTQRLVQHGIKSVLTTESLPIEVTAVLIRQFYHNLSQGYPVDFSLNWVREELICVYGFDQLYWARSILNLQPESDGYIANNEIFEPVSHNGFDDKVELDWLDEESKHDDPTYQEDSAVVADLFRQVANPITSGVGREDTDLSPPVSPVAFTSSVPSSFSSKGRVQGERTVASTVRMIVGVVGTSAIALLGLWWQHRQPSLAYFLPPIYESLLNKPFEIKLKTASASNLTAIALEKFKQADFKDGYLAVEELLDRGELQNASVALAAISPQQAETSEINFLRGRVAWQSVQLGDKNYSLEDVCHYWETAIKYEPNSPLYYNALGFAYYAAGNLERANQTWFQSLYLVQEQQAAKTTNTIPAITTFSTDQIALNAYAGLAMVINKVALNQPSNKQADLLSEVMKLRQKVLHEEPVKFQPENLSKNWLWTNQTIQDWRSLMSVKN